MKNAVVTMLDTIRLTPATTKSQAQTILTDALGHPEYNYIDWCITAWYKIGITTAETFSATKTRIAAMDDTQYGFANGRMANVAVDLMVKKITKLEKEAQLTALGLEIASYEPKDTPDQDTLDLWNTSSPAMMGKHFAELAALRLQQEIEAIEE